LGGEACRINLWKGASIYILAVACHAHANRMPLAWQSHDHSWMIEDVILNINYINHNKNRFKRYFKYISKYLRKYLQSMIATSLNNIKYKRCLKQVITKIGSKSIKEEG
jgi:hypothetical protein